MRIEVIGQRLLTGRIAVAQAAVTFAKWLHQSTKAYADKKLCWNGKGQASQQPPLSNIPQLRAHFKLASEQLQKVENLCMNVEYAMHGVLKSDGIPDMQLVQAIAVAKIQAVEVSIDYCFKLNKR